jgi:hypothetical protein
VNSKHWRRASIHPQSESPPEDFYLLACIPLLFVQSLGAAASTRKPAADTEQRDPNLEEIKCSHTLPILAKPTLANYVLCGMPVTRFCPLSPLGLPQRVSILGLVPSARLREFVERLFIVNHPQQERAARAVRDI